MRRDPMAVSCPSTRTFRMHFPIYTTVNSSLHIPSLHVLSVCVLVVRSLIFSLIFLPTSAAAWHILTACISLNMEDWIFTVGSRTDDVESKFLGSWNYGHQHMWGSAFLFRMLDIWREYYMKCSDA